MGKDRRDRNERYSQRRERQRKRRRKEEKKSRSCCANCLITLVVLFIFSLGLLYGGGMFAWNQYAKPMFGISFNDALGLVGSTYIAKEKDIVTNPYKDEDVDGFYNELSEALFLDDSVNLKENLSAVLDSYIATIVDKDNSSSGSDEALSTEGEEGSTSGSFSTGNEALDNFLKALKFDFSSLKDYQDEYATPHVLEVTDKQTAAFLNNTIKSAANNEAFSKKLPDFAKDVKLGDIVDIPQIIVTSDTAVGLENVALTLTVKVNLRKTVKTVAQNFHKLLGPLAGIVPKALYATITIYPNDYLKGAQIKVNSFSDKKMADLYSIANYFLKDSQYKSIDGILQMVNQKAVEAIEKVQSLVPINFVATGSVEVHPIKALMTALKATDVTETQFYCMIRDLCLPTFDDVKNNMGFDELDIEKVEDIAPYIQNAKGELVDEIALKYGIEEGYLNADNMLDQLKSVGGESSELIDKVSLSRLNFSDGMYIQQNARVGVKYAGLAGLLDGYLNNASGEGLNIEYKIINAMYEEEHNKLSLVLQLGILDVITQKMEEGSILKSFVGQLIPKYIYIKASVCLDDDAENAAQVAINKSSEAETQALLDTIGSLTSGMGVSMGLNYTELTSTIGTKVKDGIKDIDTKLGTSITFTEEKAYLPSVYEIMANKILYKEEVGADNLTPSEVYDVFKGACEINNSYKGQDIASDLTAFTTRVNTRYALQQYVNPEDASDVQDYRLTVPAEDDTENTIVKQLQKIGGAHDKAINGIALADSWKSATALATTNEQKLQIMHEEFSPYATEAEAAKIFGDAFKINTTGVKGITLNKVMIFVDPVDNIAKLRLIYTCEYDTTESTKYTSVLPDFVINVVFDLTKVETEDPCCNVTINDMSEEEIHNFSLMCERLGITGFNIDTIRANTNTAVKDGLREMFNKVEISIDTNAETKGIYFGSLFDVTYKNRKDAIDAEIADATALDVANTIAALHTGIESYGQKDIIKQISEDEFNAAPSGTYYKYNSILTPPEGYHQAASYDKNIAYYVQDGTDYVPVTDVFDATKDITIGSSTLTAQMSARNVGAAILSADMSAMVGQVGISSLHLYQVATIDLDNTLDSDVVAKNTLLKNTLSNMITATTGGYILVSFDIVTSELSYKSSLLPEHLYLSATLENSNSLDNVKIEYNNMSQREIDVLKALAGASGDSFDTAAVAQKMRDSLYGVTLFTFNGVPFTMGTILTAGTNVVHEEIDTNDLISGYFSITVGLPTP